ncbi:MAG TPA: glycoside hydrolase family 2 TIM barrel-domain containing protein [Candidatus Dormibacteraeota bacterium]|nr:glycoside hydrolase family 2 TIM barrel-domain containing protein [Candidatus Dormibacteraeota bacterium]
MSDCLLLPLEQRSGGKRELSGWEAVWKSLGEGEAERLPFGRGAGWKPVGVPRQLTATSGAQSVWYRTTFPRPDHSGRVILRIGGAFTATHAWLNGRLLGSHYGHFSAFGFDLTPYLKPDNELVICCESPVETQLDRKRHIMGHFNDGDLRPYPASAYMSLGEPYRWEVPLGLWRPVELEYVGPVVIDWLRLKPGFEAGDGRLEVETRLRNLDGRQMDGEVELVVTPTGAALGSGVLRLRREFRIAGGGDHPMSMRLALPGARRWEPWRFGDPAMYRAEMAVYVNGAESARVEDGFGFRDLKSDIGPRRWSVSVNDRPMFLRGACYAPSCRMDELTAEQFAEDIRLAKATNLDALRVIANVLPHDFYRLADEAGMLLLQELPLLGTYAYQARADDAKFFESTARELQAEMVELLRNHPSIAVWIAHDDPPWLADNADMGDVHVVRQNHSIDQDLKAGFEALDSTRPALAASGETDAHMKLGWEQGTWKDMIETEPLMVSAFGAQSLPSIGSPVWDDIGDRFPVADDEPSWRYAGFQPVNWAERGVGLPSAYPSLDAYVRASQNYHAWLVRVTAEHMRTRKFEPCWGAFAFHLVDPFPAIGWGLLDGARQKKEGPLAALAEAFRPTRVMIDPISVEPDRPTGAIQRPDKPFSARVIVVNDDPRVAGSGTVRWSLTRERGVGRRGVSRLIDATQRKSFSGSAQCEVPTAFEPALNATSVSVALSAEGEYVFEATLLIGGEEIDHSELRFTVTANVPPARLRPELPHYLAARLADLHSLQAERDGLSLVLENGTRPAVLTSMTGLRLDGTLLTRHDIQIDTHAGRAPLPRRLDLPLGRRIKVHVVTGEALAPGLHTLEADVSVAGVGSGRLLVEGSVTAEASPAP